MGLYKHAYLGLKLSLVPQFHSLAPMYYRGSAAAVIVYDITKQVGAPFRTRVPFMASLCSGKTKAGTSLPESCLEPGMRLHSTVQQWLLGMNTKC